jgi:GNAT superfamily N-acetyltransferase
MSDILDIKIVQATAKDAPSIAVMVRDLLHEIMTATGVEHFTFDLEATSDRCQQLIEEGKYIAYQAIDSSTQKPVGFIGLCESYALYAEGIFGIVQEFYVTPTYRHQGIGSMLAIAAKMHGKNQDWKRLELCTPPLPEFDRTVSFYQSQGFEVTGGKKMKYLL